MREIVLYISLLVLLPVSANAACSWVGNTGTVASACGYSDFNDCVTTANAHASGGNVSIQFPVCSPSTAWSSSVSVNLAGMANVTNLTIQGMNTSNVPGNAGSAQTVIVGSVAADVISITLGAGKFVLFKNITLQGTGQTSYHSILFINGVGQNGTPSFRVTNCLFYPTGNTDGIRTSGYPLFGVIDNNYFSDANDDGTGDINAVRFSGDCSDPSSIGHSWSDAETLGTIDLVYFENNTVKWLKGRHNAITDSFYGARYAIRYNDLYGNNIGVHGYDSSACSTHTWEVYNNNFLSTLGSWWTMIYPRGGSGIFANNHQDGNFGSYAILVNYRSDCPNGTTCGTYGTGMCDGTRAEDGNLNPPGNGWPCYQQVGTGSGYATGTTKPCTANYPAYIWGNTGAKGNPPQANIDTEYGTNVLLHIMTNRANPAVQDYYSGVAKPGWTPYTCPHPLVGTGSCNPSVAGTAGYVVSNSSGSNDSSGGGCFIATAAYGSYLDPHVYVLRDFRDRYLLTNSLGRVLMNCYYRNSPPVAVLLARHETLKIVARWALTTVVCGVEHPYGISTILLIPAIIILVLKRKKVQRHY